jgi:hypothetical protein
MHLYICFYIYINIYMCINICVYNINGIHSESKYNKNETYYHTYIYKNNMHIFIYICKYAYMYNYMSI